VTVRPVRTVAVTGALGRMGSAVCRAVREAPDLELLATVDPRFHEGAIPEIKGRPGFASLEEALADTSPDVVVDFTVAESAAENIRVCLRAGTRIVVGTTGVGREELEALADEADAAGGTVFIAPNFAVGAVLMMEFARQAARHLTACEVVELHHDRKLDAPSGTARRTADLIEDVWLQDGTDKTVPIHSVRLPGLVAHQEVIFGGLGQTLTIRHDSIDRESFMPGVLLAVRRVGELQGLVVGLENLL
jgi:4-hydroxy-tetrahydrodipicolinate reductase